MRGPGLLMRDPALQVTSQVLAAWRDAAGDLRTERALASIFEEAEDLVRSHRPLCLASGRCCRFREHGHRLYVSGLEATWFLERLASEQGRLLTRNEVFEAGEAGTCPLLEDGLCSVHAIRPFACRSYFCDPRAGWQQEAYERWHARIRSLHEEFRLPYVYSEWGSMLGAILDAGWSEHPRATSEHSE